MQSGKLLNNARILLLRKIMLTKICLLNTDIDCFKIALGRFNSAYPILSLKRERSVYEEEVFRKTHPPIYAGFDQRRRLNPTPSKGKAKEKKLI